MPVNSEFSGSKLKVYLTFLILVDYRVTTPHPLTQVFGKAFVERG